MTNKKVVAIVVAIIVLFLGIFAFAESADNNKDKKDNNGGNQNIIDDNKDKEDDKEEEEEEEEETGEISSNEGSADRTAPVITLRGKNEVIIDLGEVYEEEGALVTDNKDANKNATFTGNVNTNVAGIYTLTYKATDRAGNKAKEVIRTVKVRPVIELVSDERYIVDETGTLIIQREEFETLLFRPAAKAVLGDYVENANLLTECIDESNYVFTYVYTLVLPNGDVTATPLTFAVKVVGKTLAQAKLDALADLQAEFDSYDSDDYKSKNWNTMISYKTSGDLLIESATDISGVESALDTAKDNMKSVKSKSQVLAQAKEDAQEKLQTEYDKYDESNYSEANWALLEAAYNNGLTKIDSASKLCKVKRALNTAIKNMKNIKTIAQELAEAKLSAKAELDAAYGTYTKEDYTEANWALLEAAYNTGLTAIEDATDTAGVESARSTALSTMAAIETIEESLNKELTAAKNAAILALQTAYATYNESDYTEGNWDLLESAYNTGLTEIANATDIPSVETAKSTALSAMAAIETKAQTLAKAKSDAKTALGVAYGKYKSSNYTTENWTLLVQYKTQGDDSIDDATDLAGVESAKNAAISGMASIEKKIGQYTFNIFKSAQNTTITQNNVDVKVIERKPNSVKFSITSDDETLEFEYAKKESNSKYYEFSDFASASLIKYTSTIEVKNNGGHPANRVKYATVYFKDSDGNEYIIKIEI